MGKKAIAMVLILSVIITLGLSTTALGSNNEYVADNYSTTKGGINTYNAVSSYSTYYHGDRTFSGVLYYWDPAPGGWVSASTHKALCNKAWNSYVYNNGPAQTAVSNLNTNCMFTFMGHADRYNLKTDYNSSYICMYPGYENGNTGTPAYMCYQGNLDDMAFALLLGCKTAEGNDLNITWYMRCGKGVDTVVGFDKDTTFSVDTWADGGWRTVYPADVWNTYFWTATQGVGSNVGSAANAAALWTKNHCNNFAWNMNYYEPWGNASQTINTPHNGIIEL